MLHVIGPKNELASPGPGYHVLNYVDRMDLALAAADLMICRSGANSVIEASAVGVPAVYVPLPIGNGEQALNARAVVDAGGAVLVSDADMNAAWVTSHVPPIVTDRARLEAMSKAASDLVPRDADERLARIVLETAQGGRS